MADDQKRDEPDCISLLRWQVDVHGSSSEREGSKLHALMAFSFTLLSASAILMFHYKVYAVGFVVPFVYATTAFMALECFNQMIGHVAARDFFDLQIYSLTKDSFPDTAALAPWCVTGGALTWKSIASFVLEILFGGGGGVAGYLCIGLGWYREPQLWWVALTSTIVYSACVLLGYLATKQALRIYAEVSEAMERLTGFPREALLLEIEGAIAPADRSLQLKSAYSPHRQAVLESIKSLVKVDNAMLHARITVLRRKHNHS